MNPITILTLVLSALTTVLIPTVIAIVRIAIRAARMEDRIGALVTEVKEINDEKEKTHRIIFGQMKDDRAATDRRLRWLEEHLWRRGSNAV